MVRSTSRNITFITVQTYVKEECNLTWLKGSVRMVYVQMKQDVVVEYSKPR